MEILGLVLVLVSALVILATALSQRAVIARLRTTVELLEEELTLWRSEAAEIEDEEKCSRFDRALHKLCSDLDERAAGRIATALHDGGFLRGHVGCEENCYELITELSALVLREIQNAWAPDEEAA